MITGKVNIILTANWIIRELAESLEKNKPDDLDIFISEEITTSLIDGKIINYYFAFENLKHKTNQFDMCFFTHPNNKSFIDTAKISDHCVVMCKKYKDLLINNGIAGENVSLIYPFVKDLYKPTIKVFQPVRMTSSSNRKFRKGHDLWDKVCKIPFVEAKCSDGNMSIEELCNEYKNSDVVVLTSIVEGGPMGVVEALSCGCDVVAPRGVGFVDDFDNLTKYTCGCFEELYQILIGKYEEKRKISLSVSHLTEKNWCESHYNLFRLITKKIVDK